MPFTLKKDNGLTSYNNSCTLDTAQVVGQHSQHQTYEHLKKSLTQFSH